MTDERPLVLPMPREAELGDSRARLFVAALVAPASVVLLSEPTTLRVVVGSVGLLVSVIYVAAARRAGRGATEDDRLTLDSSGLSLRHGGRERVVRWDAIESIDVDADAATLIVAVRGDSPIAIAPGFGGLGTVALHELLERHRHGANVGDHG